MTVAEQFSAYVREFCNERKGGQTELEQSSGVSQPTISRIVSGNTANTRLQAVSAISEVLGLKLVKSDPHSRSDNDDRLKAALERIALLEKELYQAQGEIRSLQGVCDKAMALLAERPPGQNAAQGKSYALPESNTEQGVG